MSHPYISFRDPEFRSLKDQWDRNAETIGSITDTTKNLHLNQSPGLIFQPFINEYEHILSTIERLAIDGRASMGDIAITLVETSRCYTNAELQNKRRIEEHIRRDIQHAIID